MDLRKLHRPYRTDNTSSVEAQIRWLQKQGFAQHQIDQAIILVYSEIERGQKEFIDGDELNAYLKETIVNIRNDELTAYVTKLEEFEAKMRKKWEEDFLNRTPFWKKILTFGIIR